MTIQFLALQGNGGQQVPFDRRNEPQYQSIAQNPTDALRLKRYEEHWKFYQGIHWSFTRNNDEPLVSANYCRTVVNKKASWLCGKGMILDTPQALRGVTLPILKKVWKDNNEQQKLFAIAITGGVTGDVFVIITAEPPSDVQRQITPDAKSKIRIRLIGSEQGFPKWDPLNMEILREFKIVTEVYDDRVETTLGGLPPNLQRFPGPQTAGNIGIIRRRKWIEIIRPTEILEGWEGDEPQRRPNALGEIPMVHIANEIFPNEYFGLSDLDGVIDIQREFNEKMTDISDIVNYHSAPITIVQGAKAKSLERGPKNIWTGLPSDAKVYNLELGSDLPASHKYLELVRQIMMDISGLPEGSLGRIQSISNTSAAALEVQFQPLVEATDRKRPNYEEGIRKINYFILRTYQLLTKTSLPNDLCRHCGGRIVRFKVKGRDGQERIKKKCYLVDPQTLDFMDPEDVEVSVVVEHSFGNETRKMPYGQAKKFWGMKSPSYWDPEPKVDKQEEAIVQKDHQDQQLEDQKQEAQSQVEDQHAREMEQIQAKKPPPKPPAAPAAPKGGA